MFKAFVSFKIIMTALRQGTSVRISSYSTNGSIGLFQTPQLTVTSFSAVVPVLSAVIILVFVTCIAAVFAVHLFHRIDQWNFGECLLGALLKFFLILFHEVLCLVNCHGHG